MLNMEGLVESARLTGRIDLLMELRDWLDGKIKNASAENERLRERQVNHEREL